ncbi:hypothetical protein CC80DRAFT_544232 [Byssothecium circinans]|uniref:Uncharacterized protein n=1 Tax=Byssothecium circinans TaxID=147558 RepID=A0A6A5UD55_9PLEO|nr:hypothetical protein CC80DRAFT_544232 [Byssothecium circinans]
MSSAAALPSIDLLSRLRDSLLPLVDQFKEARAASSTVAAVSPRAFDASFDPQTAEYYEMLAAQGIKFYTVRTAEVDEEAQAFLDDPGVDDALKQGTIMHCCCEDAAFVFYNVLKSMIDKDDDLEQVDWAHQSVCPRKVFFPDDEHGMEYIYSHDFLILHAKGGFTFVLDPTGAQFGFEDVLTTLEAYEENCLNPEDKRTFRCPEKKLKKYENTLKGGDPWVEQLFVLREVLARQ